jgi:hypothetical protein
MEPSLAAVATRSCAWDLEADGVRLDGQPQVALHDSDPDLGLDPRAATARRQTIRKRGHRSRGAAGARSPWGVQTAHHEPSGSRSALIENRSERTASRRCSSTHAAMPGVVSDSREEAP